MDFYVIGDSDMVHGLRLAGVQGCVASGRESAIQALRDARARPACAVVLLSERLASTMRDELEECLYTAGLPLIVEIPDASGPSGTRVSIAEILRKAVGVSL